MSQTQKQPQPAAPETVPTDVQAGEPYTVYEEYSAIQPPREAGTIILGDAQSSFLREQLRHTAAGIRAHATRWVAAILLLLATVCSAWLLTPQPANNRPPGRPRTPPAKSAGVRSHRHQGLTANTTARQRPGRATPRRRAPQTRPSTTPPQATSTSHPATSTPAGNTQQPASSTPPTQPSPTGGRGGEQVEGGPFSP